MVMVGMMLEKEPIVKGLLQTTKDRAYFLDSSNAPGAPLGTLVKLGYPFPLNKSSKLLKLANKTLA